MSRGVSASLTDPCKHYLCHSGTEWSQIGGVTDVLHNIHLQTDRDIGVILFSSFFRSAVGLVVRLGYELSTNHIGPCVPDYELRLIAN